MSAKVVQFPKPGERPPADEGHTRRVTVMTDHDRNYPALNFDVFVAGNSYEESQFAEMFVRAECTKAATASLADLVVFTGGSDVSPVLYGEQPHQSSRFNKKRDESDLELYLFCLRHGIPMFGVCRGAQFLHVMQAGKLYQDVNNHNTAHGMLCHTSKKLISHVSSVHHQACRINIPGGMVLLGTIGKSTSRTLSPNGFENGPKPDVEAFHYPGPAIFGVQGHPEYRNYDEFTLWCLNQMDVLFNQSTDLGYIQGKQRLPKEQIKANITYHQKNMAARVAAFQQS